MTPTELVFAVAGLLGWAAAAAYYADARKLRAELSAAWVELGWLQRLLDRKGWGRRPGPEPKPRRRG